MKASIVAFLGGVRDQGQSLTRIMTSPRLSSIASQTGGQMLWELRHELAIEECHRLIEVRGIFGLKAYVSERECREWMTSS